MMKNAPDEITVRNLEVVVMPNGEVICRGKTIGWVKNDLGKYLDAGEEMTVCMDSPPRRCEAET